MREVRGERGSSPGITAVRVKCKGEAGGVCEHTHTHIPRRFNKAAPAFLVDAAGWHDNSFLYFEEIERLVSVRTLVVVRVMAMRTLF